MLSPKSCSSLLFFKSSVRLFIPCSSKSSVSVISALTITGNNAIITNTTDKVYIINKNDKIAQLIITPIILAEFVESLGEERGANGFGSTDKK